MRFLGVSLSLHGDDGVLLLLPVEHRGLEEQCRFVIVDVIAAVAAVVAVAAAVFAVVAVAATVVAVCRCCCCCCRCCCCCCCTLHHIFSPYFFHIFFKNVCQTLGTKSHSGLLRSCFRCVSCSFIKNAKQRAFIFPSFFFFFAAKPIKEKLSYKEEDKGMLFGKPQAFYDPTHVRNPTNGFSHDIEEAANLSPG